MSNIFWNFRIKTQIGFPCRTTQRPSSGTILCFSFLFIIVDYFGFRAHSAFWVLEFQIQPVPPRNRSGTHDLGLRRLVCDTMNLCSRQGLPAQLCWVVCEKQLLKYLPLVPILRQFCREIGIHILTKFYLECFPINIVFPSLYLCIILLK